MITDKIRIIDRRHGFTWINRQILRDYGVRLGPYGLAVYLALTFFANQDTQEAYPSKQTIGKLIGISPRKTRYEIKKLQALRLLDVLYELGRPYCLYTLMDPPAEELAEGGAYYARGGCTSCTGGCTTCIQTRIR